LIRNNLATYWVPEFVQKNRFHNWLVDVKDWCFSRNRIWGNPIPLWASEDGEEVICVGSIEELEKLSGVRVKDLHRDYVDHITIPSRQGKGQLKRIDEVFDWWFESGSMPFAQPHYPFSITEEQFNKKFPANFIAEGLDQTRGWFYTLNVISTALKNWEPYKNLIVNGLILAEDGSKMSKSKQNFPDPMKMVNEYSADSLKLYMLNSPVVRAEPLKFSIEGVKQILRNVFLPWYNSYRFLIQNIYRMEESSGINFIFDPDYRTKTTNILDKWIIGAHQNLIKFFRHEMDHFKLDTVLRHLLDFLDDLTKWYIRLNRGRMKGLEGEEEMRLSLNTLFDVLFSTTVMMSCFTPFISEFMYLNLKNGLEKDNPEYQDSIHFLKIPKYLGDEFVWNDIIESVNHMKKLVELVRQARDHLGIPIKKPIKKVTVINSEQSVTNSLHLLKDYFQLETNTIEIEESSQEDLFVTYQIEFNHKSLGQRLQKDYNQDLRDSISTLSKTKIKEFISTGKIEVNGIEIFRDDLFLHKVFKPEVTNSDSLSGITDDTYAILIDYSSSAEIEEQYLIREFITKIQKFRKALDLSIDDEIEIFYSTSSLQLLDIFSREEEKIRQTLLKPFRRVESMQRDTNWMEIDFEGEKVTIYIKK
jgi:isoleucyl-tRNA synthetase